MSLTPWTAGYLRHHISKHQHSVSGSAVSNGGHHADSSRYEQYAAIYETYWPAKSKKSSRACLFK